MFDRILNSVRQKFLIINEYYIIKEMPTRFTKTTEFIVN